MKALRWLFDFFNRKPGDGDSQDALRRAWVRDQILDARLSLLEQEANKGEQTGG